MATLRARRAGNRPFVPPEPDHQSRVAGSFIDQFRDFRVGLSRHARTKRLTEPVVLQIWFLAQAE
jgi:hypothetical protein